MNKPLSRVTARPVVAVLTAALALSSVAGCEAGASRGRWVVTEDTRVDIDWDAVNQAYRDAEGPEDFERRVNEIYGGDEVISVSVRDQDDRSQVVTGFFDRDGDGSVGEREKVFSIQRDVVGEGAAQYQISGHGPYASYHSPMWDIAAGMMLGSFLSNMFMPGYRPMYMVPYSTSPVRRGALLAHRDSFRAANPGKFPAKSSSSGRSYGGRGGAWGSGGAGTRDRDRGGSRRGGSFGLRAGRTSARLRA